MWRNQGNVGSHKNYSRKWVRLELRSPVSPSPRNFNPVDVAQSLQSYYQGLWFMHTLNCNWPHTDDKCMISSDYPYCPAYPSKDRMYWHCCCTSSRSGGPTNKGPSTPSTKQACWKYNIIILDLLCFTSRGSQYSEDDWTQLTSFCTSRPRLLPWGTDLFPLELASSSSSSSLHQSGRGGMLTSPKLPLFSLSAKTWR